MPAERRLRWPSVWGCNRPPWVRRCRACRRDIFATFCSAGLARVPVKKLQLREAGMMADPLLRQAAVWLVAYALALGGSGWVVMAVLRLAGKRVRRATGDSNNRLGGGSADDRQIGRIMGKLENIFIVTFGIGGGFGAPGILGGGKRLVRRGRGPSDVYIIIGTLTNLAWSLL